MTGILRRTIALALMAVGATGATLAANAPATAPVAPPVPAPSAPTQAAPQKSAVSDDYIIGPGDVLEVFVWRNPELTKSLPVRPDGKISTPLNEDMVAVGKTPSTLARDIEKVLSEFVRTPQVNVIVTTAASTYSQVKCMGQVRQPHAMAYREGLRVADVVLACQGLTDFAAPNRARVVRQVNGKTEEIRVRLGSLLEKGDLKQDIELKPGDVLIVPQSLF